MDSKEYSSMLENLKQMGLNLYEAKVYLGLLERPSMDTFEISKVTGVPRARTYDVLDSLVAKGLASIKPGKMKKFCALDIDAFRRRLYGETQQEFDEKIKNIDTVSLTLKKKFDSFYSQKDISNDPLDYIEIIKDKYQISAKYCELMRNAKSEILAFSKPPYTKSKTRLEEQYDEEVSSLKKGISMKSIYEIPEDKKSKEWIYYTIDSLIQQGEQARVIEKLPMKMAVFDEKISIIALEDPVLKQISLTSMIIEHLSLAQSFRILFNTVWEQAQDYKVLEKMF
jgi:sugar-specific transcriptional regulator TrmB